MRECCRVRHVFECPVCGRQTVVLEHESSHERPFVCDMGHRLVEMEQRLPEAFVAAFQHSEIPEFPPDV